MPIALVIDGHPNPASLTAAIADAYAAGYGDATVLRVRDLDFDPHMRFGYTAHMPLEPDLADAKRAMHAANRIVVVSPMWWGSIPALLKGFFDRALLPREEYSYAANGWPIGLLAGRRGRLILLADTPVIAAPILGLPAIASVKKQTMKLVGLRPTKVTKFLGVKTSGAAKRASWIEKARAQGVADRLRDASMPDPSPRLDPFADELDAPSLAAHRP